MTEKTDSEKDWFKSAPVDKVTIVTTICLLTALAIFLTFSISYGIKKRKQPTEIQAPKSN